MRTRTTLLILACAASLANATDPIEAREPERLNAGRAGSSDALIFSSSGVDGFHAMYPDLDRPESSRRDGTMTIREVGPMMAMDSWPTPFRPALDDQRTARISRSATSFIFYSSRRYMYHRLPSHRSWRYGR